MTHDVLPFPFEADKTLVDGRFLIKGELGQGGMGRCYRVWQQSLDRVCVLKMLAPKLHPRFFPAQDARTLLENEAKTLSLLGVGNECFVQVIDRGVLYIGVRQDAEVFELDLPYYVMDYLHGFSLEVLIDVYRASGELVPWNEILSLCLHMVRALNAAHERGVIHRDLKPDNIFLHLKADSSYVPKLIDFGVSTREGTPPLFGTGTARYGTPELLSRSAPRESTQSDMYPLGLVFFELAALRGPFVGNAKGDYIRAHVHEPPPQLSELRSDAPPFFVALCARLLAKDPQARPTAKEVIEILERELARRGDAKEQSAELKTLLQSVGRKAARTGAAVRAASALRGGRAASTVAAESRVDAVARKSGLYLTHVPTNLAADRRTMPFDSSALARAMASEIAPIVAPPPVLAVGAAPAVAVVKPVIIARPAIEAATSPRAPSSLAVPGDDTIPDALPIASTVIASAVAPIDDVPDVPVFRSMAQVFEAVWEDDDRYMPSPLSTTELPVAPRPNSSLAAVAVAPPARPRGVPAAPRLRASPHSEERYRPPRVPLVSRGFIYVAAGGMVVGLAGASWAHFAGWAGAPVAATAGSPPATQSAQPSAAIRGSAEAIRAAASPAIVGTPAAPPAPQAASAPSTPAVIASEASSAPTGSTTARRPPHAPRAGGSVDLGGPSTRFEDAAPPVFGNWLITSGPDASALQPARAPSPQKLDPYTGDIDNFIHPIAAPSASSAARKADAGQAGLGEFKTDFR